jgi:hypothetical protein
MSVTSLILVTTVATDGKIPLMKQEHASRKARGGDVYPLPPALSTEGVCQIDDRPMEAHQSIEDEWARLCEEFSRTQSQAVVEAQKKLYRGASTEAYQRALAEASSAPDERLGELAQLAAQSGLRDLAQAVAVVDDGRKPGGRSELFASWVSQDPARQAAHARLKGTPKGAQFHARTQGVKPPRAKAEDLQPTYDDRQKAAAEKAAKDAPRVEFFGGVPEPRREVGRRIA